MVKVKAPAKVNLSLDIVSKRPDGYHDVAMVMQAISLFDEVSIAINDGEGDKIEIRCDNFDVPLDETNLCAKAAAAFFSATDLEPKPLSVTIDKMIPTQAGLAGGSADAAAMVLGLNRQFDTRLSMKEMVAIGEKIGSDVPFCLLGGTMLATGTGTTLKKLPSLPKCYFVVVKPDLSVSTAEAYQRWDVKNSKGFLFTDEVVKQLCRKDVRALGQCLYNEFEQVLSLEEINEIKKRMLKQKALGASMSGSGSAVFSIFVDEKKARRCAHALKEDFDRVFLAAPLTHGCEVVS